MTETSGRPASLHAYIGYPDALAAIEFLTKGLGFTLLYRFPEEGDEVVHAELRAGDVAMTMWSDTEGYERPPRKGDSCGQGYYIAVAEPADVDAVHASAVAAGAESVWVPEKSEWNYRCRVTDPQGVEWTFGTYKPGEPGDWS